MKVQERKELAIEALQLMTQLLPPDEHGENSDCEVLYNIIAELGGLKPHDFFEAGLGEAGCFHEELTRQGDGFTYVVCKKCGVDL